MKRLISILLIACLLLSLVSCTSASKKAMALLDYEERFNILCTEMGYDAYLVSDSDFLKKSVSFSATLLSGLFEINGVLADKKIEAFSITYSDALVTYIEDAADQEAVKLSTFYLVCLLILPLSPDYEIMDKEEITNFMSDTLFPSFETVQKVGNYKLVATFNDVEKITATFSLTVLS